MDALIPKDSRFATRIQASFVKQGLMKTIDAHLTRVLPGAVEIALSAWPAISQQHGFVHAGAVTAIADTAAGYAALSLMPAGAGARLPPSLRSIFWLRPSAIGHTA